MESRVFGGFFFFFLIYAYPRVEIQDNISVQDH